MVYADELARNPTLQRYHPTQILVPDVVTDVPWVERIEPEEYTPTADVGYDAWRGIEAAITTSWLEIELYGDFEALELVADVDAEIKGFGRRTTGTRKLSANETITVPAKTQTFWVRAQSGSGTLHGSAVGM